MEHRRDDGPYGIYAEADITVEFYECDPLSVVWHGNYFNYFEVARRVLLGTLGYSYDDMKETGYAFPVIEASAKFFRYLRYRDQARVKAILEEYENRLRIKYEIHNIQTGLLSTKGVTTQMAVDMRNNESCFVCPPIFADKIESLIKKNDP